MKWPNRKQRQAMRRMLADMQESPHRSVFVCLRNGKTWPWRTAKRLAARGLAFFAGSRPDWSFKRPYRELEGFLDKSSRDSRYQHTRLQSSPVRRPI